MYLTATRNPPFCSFVSFSTVSLGPSGNLADSSKNLPIYMMPFIFFVWDFSAFVTDVAVINSKPTLMDKQSYWVSLLE